MMKKNKLATEEHPYFYVPDIVDTKELSDDEAIHAFRVLRLVAGDQVFITDGCGHLYSGSLVGSSIKEPAVDHLQLLKEEVLTRPRLEIAIAPTKNLDRIEWLLEKLTEVGIERFSIIITQRTIRRKVNMDRIERVMISAMKQSEKLSTVELHLYSSLEEYLGGDLFDGRYIGYCGEQADKRYIAELFRKGTDSSFLIGPEGDFTAEEVSMALERGFKAVSLGDERLRTETAGVYSGILHHILNS